MTRFTKVIVYKSYKVTQNSLPVCIKTVPFSINKTVNKNIGSRAGGMVRIIPSTPATFSQNQTKAELCDRGSSKPPFLSKNRALSLRGKPKVH